MIKGGATMKKLIAILLILTVLLVVSCRKQAETKDDTAATQESLDEVSSINNILDNSTESDIDNIDLDNW